MNKKAFRGADPATAGMAGSQTGQARFCSFLKWKSGLHHCTLLIELIKNHIWDTLCGVRMK